jgi:hypothetical protein
MSALGQKQTLDCRPSMSALPPKADIARRQLDVRFVPEADSCSAARKLLDYLAGNREQVVRTGAIRPISSCRRQPDIGNFVRLIAARTHRLLQCLEVGARLQRRIDTRGIEESADRIGGKIR